MHALNAQSHSNVMAVFTNVLRQGALGAEVTALQKQLNKLGYRLTEDGNFGERTAAAVRDFQRVSGLVVDGVFGGGTNAALAGKLSALNSGTLQNTDNSVWQLRPGDSGPKVKELKEALKAAGFYKGVINDKLGPDGTAALIAAKRALKIGGPQDTAGPFTMQKIKEAAGMAGTSGGGLIGTPNLNHSILRKLANSPLDSGPDGTCVATVMANLDRLGIPSFEGGTLEDPNNPRGAMVKLAKGGHWQSMALPGSQLRTIRSAYGTIQAHVLDADSYERMAMAGQIPSGAILFQTRHGWDYGGGPYGNDMGIVRDGGRVTHNYRSMPPVIYQDAREVVLMVPR
jgi:peptidoglycan hydrolase-like protein with peptidoglycan-binding domain